MDYKTNHPRTTIKAGMWAAAGLAFGMLFGPACSQAKPKVLDVWGVGDFAHGSRFSANTLLDSLAKAMNFELVKTDQASVMTAANLAQFSVVILNNTTQPGKVFNVDQRAALLGYMNKHGFVGFHGSADTKGSWPEYTAFLGGELSSHGVGMATLNLDTGLYAKNHPILQGLAPAESIHEEWYAYRTNPRLATGVRVLYTLDESSCINCTKMGGDHPIIWVKDAPEGGRTFYYAMGHFDDAFTKNAFCKTVLARAISWASNCTINSPICDPLSIHQGPDAPGATGPNITKGSRSLTVQTGDPGYHKIVLLTLSGRQVGSKSGNGPQSYLFENLKSATVYSVVTISKAGRHARLVTVQ